MVAGQFTQVYLLLLLTTSSLGAIEVIQDPPKREVCLEKSDNDLHSTTLRYHICGDEEDFANSIAYEVEITRNDTKTTLYPSQIPNMDDQRDHGITSTVLDLTMTKSPYQKCQEVSVRVWHNHENVTNSTIELEYRLSTNSLRTLSGGIFEIVFPEEEQPTTPSTSTTTTAGSDATEITTVEITTTDPTASSIVSEQLQNETSCTKLKFGSFAAIAVLSVAMAVIVAIVIIVVLCKSRRRAREDIDPEKGITSESPESGRTVTLCALTISESPEDQGPLDRTVTPESPEDQELDRTVVTSPTLSVPESPELDTSRAPIIPEPEEH